MMKLDDFRHMLDVYGADLSHWPAMAQADAVRLIDADAVARRALDETRRIDALVAQATRRDDSVAGDAASRALQSLFAKPLPHQHGRRSHWPTLLLNFDFAPAWPRLAALACCAALGFAVGLSGLDQRLDLAHGRTAVATMTDLASLVSEPEPLTGARP